MSQVTHRVADDKIDTLWHQWVCQGTWTTIQQWAVSSSVLGSVFLPVSMFQSELDVGGLSQGVEWQFGVSQHTQGG